LRHKKNNTEQHCGFGSALPLEELHITPSLGSTALDVKFRIGASTSGTKL